MSQPSTAKGDSRGSRKERQLVFKTSFRNTILDVLLARGYREAEDGETWDFNWADVGWVTNNPCRAPAARHAAC